MDKKDENNIIMQNFGGKMRKNSANIYINTSAEMFLILLRTPILQIYFEIIMIQ